MSMNRKEEIVLFVRNKIAGMVDNEQVDYPFNNDDSIKDQGMDSIKIVNLIVYIEQHFNIMFEDEEMLIDNFSTVDRITASILGKMSVQA